jgi:hypothetical protein
MVEGFDQDCANTFFDNILITRASADRFCDTVDDGSYIQVCEGVTEWHASIDTADYIALPTCNVLTKTSGGTCKEYCESQGRVCRHAQDNDDGHGGAGCCGDANCDDSCCNLSQEDIWRYGQDTSQNGCNQHWDDQICGCAEIDPSIDGLLWVPGDTSRPPYMDCKGPCVGALAISVDNSYTAYINGEQTVDGRTMAGSSWSTVDTYVFQLPNSGSIVVAVDAKDAEMDVGGGVGAILAELTVAQPSRRRVIVPPASPFPNVLST